MTQYADDRRRLSELCELLQEVRTLAEAAPVDFFTQKHWESVPAQWRDDLLGLDEDELLRCNVRMRECAPAGVQGGAGVTGVACLRACLLACLPACLLALKRAPCRA